MTQKKEEPKQDSLTEAQKKEAAAKKLKEALEGCEKPFTAESSRMDDDDDACHDSVQ